MIKPTRLFKNQWVFLIFYKEPRKNPCEMPFTTSNIGFNTFDISDTERLEAAIHESLAEDWDEEDPNAYKKFSTYYLTFKDGDWDEAFNKLEEALIPDWKDGKEQYNIGLEKYQFLIETLPKFKLLPQNHQL